MLPHFATRLPVYRRRMKTAATAASTTPAKLAAATPTVCDRLSGEEDGGGRGGGIIGTSAEPEGFELEVVIEREATLVMVEILETLKNVECSDSEILAVMVVVSGTLWEAGRTCSADMEML